MYNMKLAVEDGSLQLLKGALQRKPEGQGLSYFTVISLDAR